jgi:cysteine synthase A
MDVPIPALANEIQTISTQAAMATARRLARDEGIFAGTSTGGNVAVALRVADRRDLTKQWSQWQLTQG